MSDLWNAFSKWMNENVAPSLRSLLEPLDRWIDGLPGWSGTFCAVTLFVIAGLWAFTLKREYIYLGAPDQARWRDLRIWAGLVLLPYIVIYLLF